MAKEKKSKLSSASKDKYREIIDQFMYDFKTGKLHTYEGQPIHTEKDAMAAAIDAAKGID
jgi:hypothetical protein